MAGITLVGLGSGKPNQITLEAQEALCAAPEVWVTAPYHPVVAALPESTTVRVLGAEVEHTCPQDVDGDPETLAQVMRLSQRPEGAVVALEGHPLITSTLGLAIWMAARKAGILPRLITAPSVLDDVIAALSSNGDLRIFVCSAVSMAKAHTPPFPPDTPALITGIGTSAAREFVLAILRTVYPLDHEVEVLGRRTGRRADKAATGQARRC